MVSEANVRPNSSRENVSDYLLGCYWLPSDSTFTAEDLMGSFKPGQGIKYLVE